MASKLRQRETGSTAIRAEFGGAMGSTWSNSCHHHRHGPRYAACDRLRRAAGKAGAFLLDVGISSSQHIAKFFGLTGVAHVRAEEPAREEAIFPTPPVADDVEIIPDERAELLNGNSRPKFENATDGRIEVMAVITKALTSTGLIKRCAVLSSA